MNDNEVKTVQMTAEEAAQYAAFKAEQERKAAADKARKDRKVYGQMVDEEIEQALPMLRELSGDIRTVKEEEVFRNRAKSAWLIMVFYSLMNYRNSIGMYLKYYVNPWKIGKSPSHA